MYVYLTGRVGKQKQKVNMIFSPPQANKSYFCPATCFIAKVV